MLLLLIEDDNFFRTFYSTKLAEAGFQVEVAFDGQDAIEKLAAIQPNVILLDLIMPRKNGFDVLAEISNNPLLKTIPVIVSSTLGQEADVTRAKQLGARDYVNKTFFDFDNLLSKINEVAKQNMQT